MKTEFKAKFLRHLVDKKKDQGFTLIELLVVIIIIGILAAIALPAFLNQANKAKQSEAKTNSGSMARAQQAYYLEKNTFASQVDNLGLGIPTQTNNYKYLIAYTAGDTVVSNQGALVLATAPLKAYVTAVQVGQTTQTKEATTTTVTCEANSPGSAGGPDGTQTATGNATAGSRPTCPANYQSL
jgi:type IV pilus assembly protein PilA